MKNVCVTAVLIALTLSAQPDPRAQLAKRGLTFDETTFLRVVRSGDEEAVTLFLQAGIRATARDGDGTPAVVVAAQHGHRGIVRRLVAAGAPVDEVADALREAKRPRKDFWDKIGAVASIAAAASGFLIAIIGSLFSRAFNKRQEERLRLEADRDAALKQTQTRLAELDAVQKLIPLLTKDEATKGAALVAMRTLGSPQLAAEMAELFGGAGSIRAMEQVASSGVVEDQKQAVGALSRMVVSPREESEDARSALARLFENPRRSVVRITTGVGQDKLLGMCSGAIVTGNGHILSADFAVSTIENATYEVTLPDGRAASAIVIGVNADEKLAMFACAEAAGLPYLGITDRMPVLGDTVIALGYVAGETLMPVVGKVQEISDVFLTADFEASRLLGVGGGPVIDGNGALVGVLYSHRTDERVHDCVRGNRALDYLLKWARNAGSPAARP